MATITTHSTERRYTPDRRVNSMSKSRLSAIDWIAMALVIVGGVNWGLIGLFSFDLVAAIFGAMTTITRIVYTLVGLSAVWMIFACMKMSNKTP
jgi:uncharacterized protein